MTVRVGIVGAGKMGISHYAVVNAHPDATVAAVCDTSGYVLSVLEKYGGIQTFKTYQEMIDRAGLDAVIVATPTATHFACAEYALEHGVHVFVEKPLTLRPAESRALSELAIQRKRVNQVGFHNRFLGTFQEARRLVGAGALGEVSSSARDRLRPGGRQGAVLDLALQEVGGRRLPPRLRLPCGRPA